VVLAAAAVIAWRKKSRRLVMDGCSHRSMARPWRSIVAIASLQPRRGHVARKTLQRDLSHGRSGSDAIRHSLVLPGAGIREVGRGMTIAM
jgi:hypothetical protein